MQLVALRWFTSFCLESGYAREPYVRFSSIIAITRQAAAAALLCFARSNAVLSGFYNELQRIIQMRWK